LKKLVLLIACIKPLLSRPGVLLPTLWALIKITRSGGITGLKLALLQLREGKLPASNKALWQQYQQRLQNELQPFVLQTIARMEQAPLISVLIPTYNTPPHFLTKTIESIQQQWYDNWEICICDDASDNAKTLAVLRQKSKDDARIKVHFSEHNRNISGATNIALNMAKGDYVIFLDHDDLLQPQALFRVSQAIIKRQPDFIYSDEARITKVDDEILDFFLRPRFSLEKLRSTPYIVHFICFKRHFLQQLGGLDESLTISQDYDLILRTAEQTKNIVHIAEILYLWRTLSNSAGHKMQHKVLATSTRILQQHLQRCQQSGIVSQSPFFNFFNIDYPLNPDLRIAIIIPTKNCAELVKQCIDSLKRTISKVAYDIILVDHASDDEQATSYFATLKKDIQVIGYQGTFNFSAINNYAIQWLDEHSHKSYSHYLFCNNDIEAINDGWLEHMLSLGQQQDIAIVGPKLLYPDKKRIQHAGVGVGIFAGAEHYAKFVENTRPNGQLNPGYSGFLLCNNEVSAVTAACLLIQSKIFKQVNGFDEQLAVGFGDIDLCLRVGALNKRIIFTPHASLLHYESYSRGLHNSHEQDTQFFQQRWQTYIDNGDPYYNPNFSKQSYSWEIASPIPVVLETIMR